MRKLGYIYRYDDNEEKGLLFYGNDYIVKPIIFTKEDCITEVKDDVIVYFDFIDSNTAKKIELATLENFDIRYIRNYIRKTNLKTSNNINPFYFRYLSFDLSIQSEFLYFSTGTNDYPHPEKTIEGIYELYSNVKSRYKYHSDDDFDSNYISDYHDLFYDCYEQEIKVFDLHYWIINTKTPNHIYYGKNYKELSNLIDWFLYLYGGTTDYTKMERNPLLNDQFYKEFGNNNCISLKWQYLLNNISDNILIKLFKKAPMLQPVLPAAFCMKHLDKLSTKYYFPSKDICKEYYKYLIQNANTTSDYCNLIQSIPNDCDYCLNDDIDNSKIIVQKLENKTIEELISLVNERYTSVILIHIKEKIQTISNNKVDSKILFNEDIENKKTKLLQEIGFFIEKYELLLNISTGTIPDVDGFIESYKQLPQKYIDLFRDAVIDKISDYIIKIAYSDSLTTYDKFKIPAVTQCYPEFLRKGLTNKIKKIVNPLFANVNNLEDLDYVLYVGYITKKQYTKQYKVVTQDFGIKDFIYQVELPQYHNFHYPKPIQEFIIKTIIKKATNSHYNGISSFSNTEGMISWFDKYIREGINECFNVEIWEKIRKQFTDKLNKEDRWYLFTKGLLNSPSYDNIREKLEEYYIYEYAADWEYFHNQCFQEILIDDLINTFDSNKANRILKHINSDNINLAATKARENNNDYICFLIWTHYPHESIDINDSVLGTYFHTLDEYNQINCFRYLFYLKAINSKDFSASSLHDIITNNEEFRITPILDLLLYLLDIKEKSITTRPDFNKLNTLIRLNKDKTKKEYANNSWYTDPLTDFFYPCYGYQHISWDENENLKLGTVNKILFEDKQYYNIEFYDNNYSRFLDDKEQEEFFNMQSEAMEVLSSNFPVRTALIIDGYLVSAELERDLKEFILKYNIEDCCGLFNKKSGNPDYSNLTTCYADCDLFLCQCSSQCKDIDLTYHLPFYWCKKKVCMQHEKFLNPIDKWDSYKFIDLLNILYGNDTSMRNALLEVDSEIARYLNTSNRNGEDCSENTKYQDEIGIWNPEFKYFSELTYEKDCCDDEDDTYRRKDDSTYDRYNGTYAQDVMGYSDDDIDTIFDGDPDAYWNID